MTFKQYQLFSPVCDWMDAPQKQKQHKTEYERGSFLRNAMQYDLFREHTKIEKFLNPLKEYVTPEVQEMLKHPIGRAAAESIRDGRLLENYVADIIAGNTSRTTLYAIQDYLVVGMSAAEAGNNALATLALSIAGWSLAYSAGKRILKDKKGDEYTKTVENIYSGLMTAAFGLTSTWITGVDLEVMVSSTFLRVLTSFGLGTPTRLAIDHMREAMGDIKLVYETSLKDASLEKRVAAGLAIALVPAAVSVSTITHTPDAVRDVITESYDTYFVQPTVEAIRAIPDITQELLHEARGSIPTIQEVEEEILELSQATAMR